MCARIRVVCGRYSAVGFEVAHKFRTFNLMAFGRVCKYLRDTAGSLRPNTAHATRKLRRWEQYVCVAVLAGGGTGWIDGWKMVMCSHDPQYGGLPKFCKHFARPRTKCDGIDLPRIACCGMWSKGGFATIRYKREGQVGTFI